VTGRPKNLAVLLVAFLLTGIGIYNIFLKATWTLLDDGVLWRDTPQGVVAGRLSETGPAARAGVQMGDVLLGLDGEEILAAEQVGAHLAQRRSGETMVLFAAEGRRAPLVLGVPASAAQGQRDALLLPVPRGLLQPRDRHNRDAARVPPTAPPCTSTPSASCSS
jgi:S1-C subfamily serine protease